MSSAIILDDPEKDNGVLSAEAKRRVWKWWHYLGYKSWGEEPCDHLGCMSHVSHPCEGCGRQWGQLGGKHADKTD